MFLVILCLSSGLLVQADKGTAAIPVVIKERAGLDWKNTPLTVGVPVAAGDRDFQNPPRVLDQWGREVPSQAVLVSPATDTTVPRWWRISFLGTINRHDSLVYRVVPGEEKGCSPGRPCGLKRRPTDTWWRITLQLELNTTQPLVAKAWFDPGPGPFGGDIVHGGPMGTGFKDHHRSLHNQQRTGGPDYTGRSWAGAGGFRITGPLPMQESRAAFTYDCRLVVFAETPYLRLALRLINTSGQQVTMEEAWVGLLLI